MHQQGSVFSVFWNFFSLYIALCFLTGPSFLVEKRETMACFTLKISGSFCFLVLVQVHMDKDCSLEMGHLFRIGLDFTNILLYVLFSEIFQNLFIQNIKLEDILGVICYHVRILLHQFNWWCSFLIDFFKVSEQKILHENLKMIRE